MKFKSEFFKSNMINVESLQFISSDINYLLSASQEIIDLLVVTMLSADHNSDNTYFVDQLVKEGKCSKSTAECIVRAFRFIVTITLFDTDEDDNADDWADDFVTLEILEENQKEKCVEIINRIKSDITPEFIIKAQVDNAENGWMPNLISVNTSAEVRAVNRNKFKSGVDILEYDADIIDVVGVISVRIRIDDGTPDVLHFQAGRKDLNNMINKLKASLIELDALERFIKE